jgi:hypothetical protein
MQDKTHTHPSQLCLPPLLLKLLLLFFLLFFELSWVDFARQGR